jgi:hypothetical protein
LTLPAGLWAVASELPTTREQLLFTLKICDL